MNKKIVILIQSDPRESARPAEALRIALGLASCNHVVELILAHAAPLLLVSDQDPTPLVEQEEIQKYLAHLSEWGSLFFIAQEETERRETAYKTVPLRTHAMAKKILNADRFMLF